CAGVPQKDENQTRRELIEENVKVFASIIEPVVKSGFSGIFIVATNPVDVLTYVTMKLSGFPKNRVFGSDVPLP
ncbi:L-lactate dehydrogenase, partial [Acinetobacter baumannii]|nr:L-lactate dehydrogenase [Acinetobacter baumannii]